MNHDVITHDAEPPSNLDILVGMVSKTADEQGVGWLKSVTIRIPMVTALTFEAMSAYCGQSRNKLMVKALETSLDLLWEQLPQEEREQIELHRSSLIAAALANAHGPDHESGEI